jgi:hypothetical protein
MTKNEVWSAIAQSWECWLYSPSSLNPLWGWSPVDEEAGPRGAMAVAKMDGPDWLLDCMYQDDEKMTQHRLFLSMNDEITEQDGSLVRERFFAIPAEQRVRRHPFESLEFWKAIYETLIKQSEKYERVS